MQIFQNASHCSAHRGTIWLACSAKHPESSAHFWLLRWGTDKCPNFRPQLCYSEIIPQGHVSSKIFLRPLGLILRKQWVTEKIWWLMDIITSEVQTFEDVIGQILLAWCEWPQHDKAIFKQQRFIARKGLVWHTETHTCHDQVSPFSSQRVHDYPCNVNGRRALRGCVLTCALVRRDLHQRFSLLEDRDTVTKLFSVWYCQQHCKSPTLRI